MKRILILALYMCAILPILHAEKVWVDLGLPSGTLWASEPEESYYTYLESVEKFGVNMPTKWQWMELYECSAKEKVYDHGNLRGIWFKAKNGNALFLPAKEIIDTGTKPRTQPFYWTFTTLDETYVHYLNGNVGEFSIMKKKWKLSVILVSK